MNLQYQTSLSILNLEEAIERHADLAKQSIHFMAQEAMVHIHHLGELYKAQDVFRNRSEGQRLRRERERLTGRQK